MKYIFFVFILSIANLHPSLAQNDIKPVETSTEKNNFVTDYNLALSLAKDTKQEIVVIFSASWCGHCTHLKKDLPLVEGFDNKIICIIDSDKNKKLSREYQVRSLPTSIILDNQGKEISRMKGYDKESYEVWLKSSH